MKCDKCGGLAVIGMPQHRLNLCGDHFTEWLAASVQRTIERYSMFWPQDRVLVAVSGGKDSLALWDILQHLGYQTEGVYIHLGIGHEGYSDVSQAKAAQFAEQHGCLLHVVNVAETYGAGIPDITWTGRGKRVCSLCGLVKRHIMNRIAYEGDFAAIATGHNLDDEAAVLLQNTLHWQGVYLQRQAPVLPAVHPRLARKVKPLCLVYERESAAYALVRGIDFVEQECPYSVNAKSIVYKKLLNQLEGPSPSTKYQFYTRFLQAKEEGLIAPLAREEGEWATCQQCGQPTTNGELCSFCRVWQRVRHED
jgi:uncharacterized protein (TIGR00269 family)